MARAEADHDRDIGVSATRPVHGRRRPHKYQGRPARQTGKTISKDGPDASRAMARRLVRAVDTLGRLPMDANTRPTGTRSAWPDMIRKTRFAIETTRQSMPARPTPAAIDDLDRLAMLMWHLPPHQRQLLWARACGVRWAELCHRYRRSRTT